MHISYELRRASVTAILIGREEEGRKQVELTFQMRTGQLLAIFDPINRATTIWPDQPHIGRESQARQQGHCGHWHAIRWTFHLTRRGQGNKDTEQY